MNVLLNILSQGSSFSWEVSFSEQILNNDHGQSIDIVFSEVQARYQGIILSNLRSKIVPAFPVLCLHFQIGLEDIYTQERICKFEFLLAFQNIPRFQVQMRAFMLLIEPLQSATTVPNEIPYFYLFESLVGDDTIFKGLCCYFIGKIQGIVLHPALIVPKKIAINVFIVDFNLG